MSKIVWSATITAMLLAAAVGVHAQQNVKRESISSIRDVSGAASYRQYCTQCHGATAIGNGPVAKALKVPPADLTRIAQRHGGKFPSAQIKQVIRGELSLHGGRDMPLWGEAFRSVEDSAVVELRLANLVTYLEGIQQK